MSLAIRICRCRAVALVVMLSLLAAEVSAARAETLDVARFTPPSGWKETRSATVARYTHIDQQAGTYCIIGVYPSTASKGSAERDFASEWEAVVRNGFTTGAAPTPASERTSAGLSYLAGGAEAMQGEVRSYVKLLVFPLGQRVVSVLLSASGPSALAAREPAIKAFLDSLRLEGAPAAAPPTGTPTTLPAGRPTGLTVPTPAGWRRSAVNGLMILERDEDLGPRQKNAYRLVFMPPIQARGSPTTSFDSLYAPLASATFAAPARPLPLRVRLKSGATLLYDGGEVRLRQSDVQVTGMVYVVVHGGTAVGAVGVFNGWSEALDPALREVFDGLRIAGATGKEPPLFRREELVGRWRASSSALGNWVDAAGNYRGDASIATGETLSLGANGTFRSQFAVVGSGRTFRSDTSGPFTVEDDVLVLTPRGDESPMRYRVTGVGKSADGKGSFLLLGVTRSGVPRFSEGSGVPRAGDVYVGLRD